MPDAPRKWTLIAEERGKKRKRDEDVMPVTTCTQCFQAYEATTATCPYCGYKAEPESRRSIEFVDGDLIELDPATLAAMRGEVEKIDGPVPFKVTSGGRNVFTVPGVNDVSAGCVGTNVRQPMVCRKAVIWLRSLVLNVDCTLLQPPIPEHMM